MITAQQYRLSISREVEKQGQKVLDSLETIFDKLAKKAITDLSYEFVMYVDNYGFSKLDSKILDLFINKIIHNGYELEAIYSPYLRIETLRITVPKDEK